MSNHVLMTNAMTVTLPTTRTANMLVHCATGAVLREAIALEVKEATESLHSLVILSCPTGRLLCQVERREIPLTDAEYNAMLNEIEGND